MIKVAIIGSGFIAEHHCFAFSQIPEVEIIGISSLDTPSAEELVKKFNIQGSIFADYHDLLALDCVAVSICLPNFLHKEVAIAALNAGKHVFIEKPLARTVKEGEAILAAAKLAGKTIYYCENNMYAPAFVKVKEILDQKGVGQVYLARGKEHHSGPHSKWFYKQEQAGGGALLDLGVHDIACLVWFLGGTVEKVFCQTRTLQPDHPEFGLVEVEDNAVGILYFDHGTHVVIEESWTAPGGYLMHFEIYGTEGQIIADPTRMTPVQVYSTTGYGYAVEKAGSTKGWTRPVPEESWTFGYPQEFVYFIKCLKNGEQPLTDGKFGLDILRIIETMYHSAGTGKIEKVLY
ncbi:MAG: Gfo/Idh/MocA family protein [Promethearchaeota archaeon]